MNKMTGTCCEPHNYWAFNIYIWLERAPRQQMTQAIVTLPGDKLQTELLLLVIHKVKTICTVQSSRQFVRLPLGK
jgi:hypothetical protein